MSRNFLSLFVAALVVCSFALMPVAAQADTIAITVGNPGFEIPATGGGTFSSVPAGTWIPLVGSGNGAYYAYSTWGVAPHTGIGLAFTASWPDASGGYQQMKVGAAPFMIGAGDTAGSLNFSGWVYRRYNPSSGLAFIVYSDAGVTEIYNSGASTYSTAWTQITKTVSTAAFPTGVPLWFGIKNLSTGGQTAYDDIEVSYTYTPAPPIPEPSTLALLAAGLAGLLCYAWRKRR